jgi:hypothetical protein
MAFKIYKNGKLIDEAKDERTTFTPTYESEKDKPNSLFKPNEEREGLSNDN